MHYSAFLADVRIDGDDIGCFKEKLMASEAHRKLFVDYQRQERMWERCREVIALVRRIENIVVRLKKLPVDKKAAFFDEMGSFIQAELNDFYLDVPIEHTRDNASECFVGVFMSSSNADKKKIIDSIMASLTKNAPHTGLVVIYQVCVANEDGKFDTAIDSTAGKIALIVSNQADIAILDHVLRIFMKSGHIHVLEHVIEHGGLLEIHRRASGDAILSTCMVSGLTGNDGSECLPSGVLTACVTRCTGKRNQYSYTRRHSDASAFSETPDYVYFNHSDHVNRDLSCVRSPVNTMDHDDHDNDDVMVA